MNQQDFTTETAAPEQVTPEQARAALESAPVVPNSDRDRLVHAWATAGFGALVGIFVGVSQAIPRNSGAQHWIYAGYAALLLGLALWQSKKARTFPRHSTITSYIGLAGTMVLAMLAIMGLGMWENYTGEVVSISPLWYPLGALVVAAPMLIAGWVIAKRRA